MGSGEEAAPDQYASGPKEREENQTESATDVSEIAEKEKPKAIVLKFDENHPIEFTTIEEDRENSNSPRLNLPAVKKFILERGLSVTSALRRLSGLDEGEEEQKSGRPPLLQDAEAADMRGRITLFSRSGCRDCQAVRSFLRERGLRFVEINIDVFPARKAELEEKAGKTAGVPQIFFNEHLIGGIVALNSLRNSGEFDRRLKGVMEARCPDSAPAVPVYGLDDPGDSDDEADELWEMVSVLRQRLRIQDRFFKMRLVNNCFSGADAVEVLIDELDCGRKKAVEMGKRIAKKNFFRHVLNENEFEDGNHLYRFLEHDPIISTKCFNFRGFTNDKEPKPAALVAEKLRKIMIAILETFVSDDGRHVNYQGICSSEEFRRYWYVVQDLQRVNVLALTKTERLSFFINIYNSMVIHATIQKGYPDGMLERREFFNEFQYLIGGYPYSLSEIQNGILRANQRPPYSLGKPFKNGDKRLEVVLPQPNILTLFALCNGSKSSPALRFYSAQSIDSELRSATKEFFRGDGIIIDIQTRTVYVSKLLKWFSSDFGEETEMLHWIMNYLDTKKVALLSHILGNKGPINVVYQDYDSSLNL
uniref:TSA: Wollemia nobilis Ref_Wollemi_Transcript_15591_2492 transcribed RNA sequence n=1 Tax=Wollemia nobilis TaxID=56998 RepID=A0A0C9S643_9CONI